MSQVPCPPANHSQEAIFLQVMKLLDMSVAATETSDMTSYQQLGAKPSGGLAVARTTCSKTKQLETKIPTTWPSPHKFSQRTLLFNVKIKEGRPYPLKSSCLNGIPTFRITANLSNWPLQSLSASNAFLRNEARGGRWRVHST
eukprot:g13818.t1